MTRDRTYAPISPKQTRSKLCQAYLSQQHRRVHISSQCQFGTLESRANCAVRSIWRLRNFPIKKTFRKPSPCLNASMHATKMVLGPFQALNSRQRLEQARTRTFSFSGGGGVCQRTFTTRKSRSSSPISGQWIRFTLARSVTFSRMGRPAPKYRRNSPPQPKPYSFLARSRSSRKEGRW